MIHGEVGLGQGRCAVSSKIEDKLMIGMTAYCESSKNAVNSNKSTKVHASARQLLNVLGKGIDTNTILAIK